MHKVFHDPDIAMHYEHMSCGGVEDAIGINEDTDNVHLQGMFSVHSRNACSNARHQILLRHTNSTMEQIPISCQAHQEAL